MDDKKRIARLRNAEKWIGISSLGKMEAERRARAEKILGKWKAPPPAPKVIKVVNPKVELNFIRIPKIGEAVPEKPQVPKKPWTDPLAYIAWLEKKGFKVLGRGHYSTVLAKEKSDRVIKVSRHLDNWIEYIQWGTSAGYAGKFVPRVYSWKRFGSGKVISDMWGEQRTADWSVAIVEKMHSTLDDQGQDLALMNYLPYLARRGNTLAKVYMEDLEPGSVKFFEELSKHGFDSDIGSRNMMVRKDGSFCMTDPTCGRLKFQGKRLRTGEFSPFALDYEIRTNNICSSSNSICFMA